MCAVKFSSLKTWTRLRLDGLVWFQMKNNVFHEKTVIERQTLYEITVTLNARRRENIIDVS